MPKQHQHLKTNKNESKQHKHIVQTNQNMPKQHQHFKTNKNESKQHQHIVQTNKNMPKQHQHLKTNMNESKQHEHIVRKTMPSHCNRIDGVMVSVLVPSAVDRGFEPRSGQTKDYKIGICCFSSKHAALRRKSKDWLARIQNNGPSRATCLSVDCCFSQLAL